MYGKKFYVEFQRVTFKFPTKYLTHTLKYVNFIIGENFRALMLKSPQVFLKRPLPSLRNPNTLTRLGIFLPSI